MNNAKKLFGYAMWALMFVIAMMNTVTNPLGIFTDLGLLVMVVVTTGIISVVPGGAKTSKIDNFWTMTLLAMALFFDLIQVALSFIDTGAASGNIVAGIQLTVFTFVFKMLGTSYWGGRKKFVTNLASKVTTMILEFVPILAPILPSTYIQMVFAIVLIRMEEKGGALGALAGKAGGEAGASNLRNKARSKPARPTGQDGANILNNKRTEAERRARFQESRPPTRDQSSTAKGGGAASNVLDLKGQEAAKAA
jgi:hypothetical protein